MSYISLIKRSFWIRSHESNIRKRSGIPILLKLKCFIDFSRRLILLTDIYERVIKKTRQTQTRGCRAAVLRAFYDFYYIFVTFCCAFPPPFNLYAWLFFYFPVFFTIITTCIFRIFYFSMSGCRRRREM